MERVGDPQDLENIISAKLKSMTLREKLGQCVMIEPCFCLEECNKDDRETSYTGIGDPDFLNKLINDYHIGLFLFGGVSRIGDDSPEAWVNYFNQVNAVVAKTQNKVPMLYGVDAVHGVNFIRGSTIFPHNLGVVASWNTELAKDYARIVSDELKSLGINLNFAPTIDISRDQRWGRVYESLGEDAFLGAKMSKAFINGMQNNGKVAACAKHFIGYGDSGNGMDRTPANLSDREILEHHVPPFKAAIDEDVLAIMVNGGDVNGVPMPASKKMMKGLLREKLGFKGVTMSDWEDVLRLVSRHKIVPTKKEAIERAFNAGLDMNMAVADLKAVDIMESLVDEGRISMDRVNEAVGNVLRMKLKLGLFEAEGLKPEEARHRMGNKTSKALASTMVLESLTLLKNNHHILPIKKTTKSILITGQRANTKRHLCGGWTLSWGSAEEDELTCTTILEAIQATVLQETTITYAPTLEALAELNVTKDSFDLCISIVGEEPHSEWIGDTRDLMMEEEEQELLTAAVATGIPVVMVATIGRPQNLLWAKEHVEAILWSYLPGTEGAKPIADVLFGNCNPSGRLPITFPRDANQIPIAYNARKYICPEMNTTYEPLFPFGYGLSYTDYRYDKLVVAKEVKQGQDLVVSVTVTNIGEMDGATVVQLYLADSYASVTRPFKSLKAFKKVFLRAKESTVIPLIVASEDLGLYDEELDYVIEKRMIEVQIAGLKQTFRII